MNFHIIRANNNMINFEDNFKHYQADESFLNEMCYNLQQALEHYIKAIFELQGKTYPAVHQISILLNVLGDKGFHIPMENDIRQNVDSYDNWSTATRYNTNFYTTLELVNKTKEICYALKDYVLRMFESCTYSEEAIVWCRQNAPTAIKNSSNDELWEFMKDSYYKLKDL